MLVLECEKSPSTGLPENTVFRAISGNDSFYLVQYAFHTTLDPGRLSKALRFMAGVKVCDSRSLSQACPMPKSDGPQHP